MNIEIIPLNEDTKKKSWCDVYLQSNSSWFWQSYFTHIYRLEAGKYHKKNMVLNDVSLLIRENKNDIGIVPLVITTAERNTQFSYGETCGISLPFFSVTPNKELLNSVKEKITNIVDANSVATAWWQQSGVSSHDLPIFRTIFDVFNLTYNGKFNAECSVDQFQMSKRDRKYHNKNLGQFNFELVDFRNFTTSLVDEYAELHTKVAGRTVRSHLSYHLQFGSVLNSTDFCIVCRAHSGKLLGLLLISYEKNKAYDNSIAVCPTVSKSNIGLSMKILVIEELKRRECKIYQLGPDAGYPTGDWLPTEKELKISQFKQKFKTQTSLNYFDIIGERRFEF